MDPVALEEIPLFAQLALDQRESVAQACEEVEIDAGSMLVREGDFGHAAFAIREGTADVSVDGTVVRSLGPGDVFGEIAVLSGGRRTATVVASTAMRVVTVLNRDMWRLEREAPDVAEALRAIIAERLDATSTQP